ncbi:MAG: ena [Firmicutes bacterium]|nr:ena [Bacillota bacterium]
MAVTVITNIGTIVSGLVEQPIIAGDVIVIKDGKIDAVGTMALVDSLKKDSVEFKTIDAGGMTVTPGLIDSHVHPVIGDYTPRQKMSDFIDSSIHGGVTSMISAGECHTPGRPTDPAGVKALAILAHKSFALLKPGGVKVHGGSVILEKGLTEADFAEMAAAGVTVVGEVGLGSIKKPEDAAPMVAWAKKHNMKVMMHTGGTSIPGSSTVSADDVIKTDPDVVSHINGGPTAVSLKEVDRLLDETQIALEIVQCGNPKVADYVARQATAKKQLNRLIFGNDAPSGTGVIPLGILRNICQIASMSEVPAAVAVAMATGNTARVYGLNTGVIAPGKEADIVIMDTPMGSVGKNALEAIEAGDIPGVALVLVDGVVKVNKSRNTPPAVGKVTIA